MSYLPFFNLFAADTGRIVPPIPKINGCLRLFGCDNGLFFP
jgi:hypothetical protein